MLTGRREDNDSALSIHFFGHLVAFFRRMAKQLAEHSLDVLVTVPVTVPEDDVVARHFALFLFRFRLRLGNESARPLTFVNNRFVGIHNAPESPEARAMRWCNLLP